MRTTLTLDDDVAEHAKELSKTLDRPVKEIINQALRVGLESVGKPGAKKHYKTIPKLHGLRAGLNLDNIQELITQIEGEEAR